MIRLLPTFFGFVTSLLAPAMMAAQDQVTEVATRGHPRFYVASSATPPPPPKIVRPESVPVLRRRISLDLQDVRLEEALLTIAERGALPLTYSRSLLALDGRVQLQANDISVAGALAVVLLDAGIDVLIRPDGQVVLVPRGQEQALADGIIYGWVKDAATGRPIVGGSVLLNGTSFTATTVDSGAYSFRYEDLATGQYTLRVRMLGYYPTDHKVTIRETDTIIRIDLRLQEAPRRLDDVITTATGKQRRGDIGSSITTINVDSLMRAAPIKNLTDILENRVPGLTSQRTSGAPGDPARMRLRGINSFKRSNDPIVFVDGVRIYSAHSDTRSGNLANGSVPAPSPLDQIDPNSIEKVEVFKGASAATMYGADAANGVIVVTTKKGKAGPTRWTAGLEYARTTMASQYPAGIFRWGHDQHNSEPYMCPRTITSCIQDSLVRFQALNDPRYTVLDRGRRMGVSASVSGGVRDLTYSFTGSYSDDVGLLRLPEIQADRFLARQGRRPPDWMLRPQNYKAWGVSSSLGARLSSAADVSVTASVTRSTQQRSSLEYQLTKMASLYVDRQTGTYELPSMQWGTSSDPNGLYVSPGNLVDGFYQRTTASTITFRAGANVEWRPIQWLNTRLATGIEVVPRNDQSLLPSGMTTSDDSLGHFTHGTGRSIVGTFALSGATTTRLPSDMVLTTAFGMDMSRRQVDDLQAGVTALNGTGSINGAPAGMVWAGENRTGDATFGWFLEPRVQWRRLTIPIGIRFDGGDANGSNAGLMSLPKLSLAWNIGDESFFPFRSVFSSLRVRSAYGIAGRQPGVGDRLRLFYPYIDYLNGVPTEMLNLHTRGNSRLRPERSAEFEGGFDADMLRGRVSLELTVFRKHTRDMLLDVDLPPSLAVGRDTDYRMQTNIGKVRATGLEMNVGLRPLQASAVAWALNFSLSSQNSTVLDVGTVSDFLGQSAWFPAARARIVEGYPVQGMWARPIIAGADLNNDGAIQENEYVLGDSLAYLGNPTPRYVATLSSTVQFFDGALSMTMDFAHQSGALQTDRGSSWIWSPAFSDPSVPATTQIPEVAVEAITNRTAYGVARNVSTYRFNSLSINYRLPTRAARFVGAQDVAVALQGSNLGLRSSYRYGRDPNVGAVWGEFSEGNLDRGQLPLPRLWQVRVNVSY